MLIVVSDLQFWKGAYPISVTNSGMLIAARDVELLKA
jgi:hypothetical protein